MGASFHLSLARRSEANAFWAETSGHSVIPMPRRRQLRRPLTLENSRLRGEMRLFSSDRSKARR